MTMELSNGGSECPDEEVEQKVNELLKYADEDKSTFQQKIRELIEENLSLKRQIAELESTASQTFQIDTDPVIDDEPMHLTYDSNGDVMIHPDDEPNEPVKKKAAPPKSSCFNCLGSHNVSDCPTPRDQKRIAQNRREFQKKQPQMSSARYHIDEPQRFGHLSPGLPSEKLRLALGLRPEQLPSYIYRLRALGYPPGWLQRAEIKNSGMALYVAKDEVIGDIDDEEGEVFGEQDKMQYDTDKLQEWPGFNVPLADERQFQDESHYYNVPPMQSHQGKAEMVLKMKPQEQQGYVRGKMQDTTTEKNGAAPSTKPDESPKVKTAPEPLKEQLTSAVTSPKVVEDGTPIVQSYSPFDALPSQDKWAKDTTDHILFENLPDSTGKWDQMLGVIKKVREAKK